MLLSQKCPRLAEEGVEVHDRNDYQHNVSVPQKHHLHHARNWRNKNTSFNLHNKTSKIRVYVTKHHKLTSIPPRVLFSFSPSKKHHRIHKAISDGKFPIISRDLALYLLFSILRFQLRHARVCTWWCMHVVRQHAPTCPPLLNSVFSCQTSTSESSRDGHAKLERKDTVRFFFFFPTTHYDLTPLSLVFSSFT